MSLTNPITLIQLNKTPSRTELIVLSAFRYQKSAAGQYFDPLQPWGPYRWAVCDTCLQDEFDDVNKNGGKLTYRDGHSIKVAGTQNKGHASLAPMSRASGMGIPRANEHRRSMWYRYSTTVPVVLLASKSQLA
eukprot:COSAG05_NODE_418_length_10011_cov_18.784100_3_plen_133_part_00